MPDNTSNSCGFKEAVCINADRIYDTCCDRDCLEDLRCYFTPRGQEVIEQAINVRIRGAEVINVFIDVEPVHFNRGFFTCDLTFFFLVQLDAFITPHAQPIPVEGVCYFDKKVILYGSEGNVKIFSNEFSADEETDSQMCPSNNLPICNVQTVDPVALEAHICEVRDCYEGCRCMPSCVCNRLGGEVAQGGSDKAVYATLGLFTIVQLVRKVAMLIPVYDFCIPEKECSRETPNDNPCDLFNQIKFPTNDFFPPREGELGCNDCFPCGPR